MTSSCLFNRSTTFSQTVTDTFFSQHFRKWELISFDQARNKGGEAHTIKIFSPPWKNVLDILKFKNPPPQKTLPPLLVSQAGYGPAFNQDAGRTIRTE